MKKIFSVLLCFVAISANAQTPTGDRVIARSAFFLKDYWITGIKRDTSVGAFGDPSMLPTAKAVQDYIAGRLAALGTATPYTASRGVVLHGNQLKIQDTLEGAGTKFMYLYNKAAFRVGQVDGTQWNRANIGDYSFATGHNTIASGFSSAAIGYNLTASGDYSIALGRGGVASGNFSTVLGGSSYASGFYSTATGSSTAEGAYSFSSGSSLASGERSFSTGYGVAKGSNSFASGASEASGDYSFAVGLGTKSKAYSGTVVGIYNDSSDVASATSPNGSNKIFEIGNGTSDANRSNALTVLQNGLGTINGLWKYSAYDTSLWDGNTLISKQFFEDRIAALSTGPSGSGDMSYSDTSAMLSPYLRAINAAATYATITNLNLKLAKTDTTAMLSPYLRSNIAAATYATLSRFLDSVAALRADIGSGDPGGGDMSYSDTTAMLSPYLRSLNAAATYATLSNLNLKLNISDTTAMLSPYLRSNIAAATYATIADLNLKLAKSDTTGMLTPYLRSNIAAATYATKAALSDTAAAVRAYFRKFRAGAHISLRDTIVNGKVEVIIDAVPSDVVLGDGMMASGDTIRVDRTTIASVPETFVIDLSHGDYTITKPGVYFVADSGSGTETISYPDPDNFTGQEIKIIHLIPQPILISDANTFAPTIAGGFPVSKVTEIGGEDITTSISVYGHWFSYKTTLQ